MRKRLYFMISILISAGVYVFGGEAVRLAETYRKEEFLAISPWNITEVLYPLLLFGALLFLYQCAVSLFRKKSVVIPVLLSISLVLTFLHLLLLWIPSGNIGGMIWAPARRASPVMACYSAWLVYALLRYRRER